MSATSVVNRGSSDWDAINDGKPSADIRGEAANAVPDVDDWQSLVSPYRPNVMTINYKHQFKWPLDDYESVHFTIELKWEFGARYREGGAFIPKVWVDVPECFVVWPWTANLRLWVGNLSNFGQPAAPLASIAVIFKGAVTSFDTSDNVQWTYLLYGNGDSANLN